MSHNKLRIEKNCLNCGDTVEERYCPHCGQENIELHDSTLHLLIHYIQDLVHYDGKTWHTMRNLIRRPGQVAAEYLDGKRVLNINPIRLYFFTSTVFFLLLFYIVKLDTNSANRNPIVDLKKRMFFLKKEKEQRAIKGDTVEINTLIEKLQSEIDSLEPREPPTLSTPPGLSIEAGEVNTPISPDSLGRMVMDSLQDQDSLGWFAKLFYKRSEERWKEYQEKYQGDQNAMLVDFAGELFHKIPQLIFLSLPFFAFYLKILYWRSKRNLYVDNLIFSIYQYSYLYSISAIYLLVYWTGEKMHHPVLDTFIYYLTWFLVIYLFIYLLLAMKRFYAGKWRFLLLKYFMLMFIMMMTIIVLFITVLGVTYLM